MVVALWRRSPPHPFLQKQPQGVAWCVDCPGGELHGFNSRTTLVNPQMTAGLSPHSAPPRHRGRLCAPVSNPVDTRGQHHIGPLRNDTRSVKPALTPVL